VFSTWGIGRVTAGSGAFIAAPGNWGEEGKKQSRSATPTGHGPAEIHSKGGQLGGR
jgi:hypothetical protein